MQFGDSNHIPIPLAYSPAPKTNGEIGERQWVIVNLIEWWLQFQLILQCNFFAGANQHILAPDSQVLIW